MVFIMKFHVMVLLCVLASISLIHWTNGFNVETKHYAIYTEEQSSMFGFSVAEHLGKDSNERMRGWVIVGAPEAQTNQPGVYRGGAVYRCNIESDNSCTPIYFDSNGNNYNTNPSAPGEVDNKTMQWFGATVSTSHELDGPILACAPRYMWYSANFVRREPVGTCYITENSFRKPKEFSPCRTKHWGYHRQGSCQAGLGAALSKTGERVVIGAPGSFYWQGQAYSVDSNAEFTYMPPRYAHFGESPGQIFSAPTGNLPIVVSTKEGQAKDDDSYLGYSVTTGDFEGEGKTGAAVGMPRGNNLHGQVVIFSSNLTNHQKNLTGDQMGAYFGYAVVSCDVNGDGLDDLIVGAPMYTIDNPGETFETGRVHIFYQENGIERFTRTDTRIGFKTRSRFGLSLASLKDIDRDGFEDFAVGAPYDGLEGRGAVYVYHGSAEGVLKTYSQVIYAEQVRSSISTFGFSIGGGLDLDGNQYPDMVVGAYESSTAAFFRSRPVIKMEAWVAFNSESKLISLEEKDCTISNGIPVSCLELNTCLTFSGLGVQQSYEFNVEYALDTKKSKNRRLFFIDFEDYNSINQTVRLTRDEPLCKLFKVFVDPDITDKLTSIEAEMRMSLIENTAHGVEIRNPRAALTPVLGTPTSRADGLSIFKSCGPDNICTPNLVLNVFSSITKYLLASGDRLEIDVLVNNTGEHAYEASFYLEKPPGIEYINIEVLNRTGIPVQCSAPSPDNNNTLLCDIGNPLPQKESVHFKVILQPIKIDGLKSYYELDMGVNSTNPEDDNTRDDNTVNFRMPIWIQTELVIEGTSRPKDLYYNVANYTVENITNEFEFGPLLTHNYTIRNDGPSAIIEAEASLTWPAATLAGDELLYLIDQPEIYGHGPISCGPANVDYAGLKSNKNPLYLPAGGSSGVAPVDRENQLAEEERRKQNEEQQNFANGTRDYNYDTETEVLVTSSGNKNMSSSYYSNYTSSGGYGTEHQRAHLESQGHTQQGNSGGYSTEHQREHLESRGQAQQGNSGGYSTEHQRTHLESQGQAQQGNSGGYSTEHQSTHFESHGQGQQGNSGGHSTEHQRTHFESHGQGQQGNSGGHSTEHQSTHFESHGQGQQGSSGGYGTEQQGTYTETHGRVQQGNENQQGGTTGVNRQQQMEEAERRRLEGLRVGGGGVIRQDNTNEQSGRIWTSVEQRQREKEERKLRIQNELREAANKLRQKQKEDDERFRIEVERQRSESARLAAEESKRQQLQREEKERQRLEAERQRISSDTMTAEEWQRLKEEEYRKRMETVARQHESGSHQWGEVERQTTYDRTEIPVEHGIQKHYQTDTENSQRHGTGYGITSGGVVREEHQHSTGNTGLNINLSNIGSSKDLEKFFSTMNSQAAAMTTYTRDGKEYVQFDGRFRISDGKEYIEFKNGQFYQILDRYGGPSYTTSHSQSEQFLNMEGQLVWGEDGSIYVELKDGRKFQIPGTYSYERKRTFTVGGGPGESTSTSGRYTYGRQVTHEGSSRDGKADEPFAGNNYGEQSYKEEYRSGQKIISGINTGGSSYESVGDTWSGGNIPTIRPEDRLSRYPRGSDVVNVEQFRKFERNQRQKRDVDDLDFDGNQSADASSSRNERRRRTEAVKYDADVVGRGVSNCESAQCVKLECTFGPLKKGDEVYIKVRYRVKAKTLNKIAFNENVKVSTQLTTRVTRQEFITDTPDEQLTKRHEIVTTIHPTAPPAAPDVIPLWVVVLSACAGTIILLLLIFLLYKLGFFKRNRPNSTPETQPLTTNGSER